MRKIASIITVLTVLLTASCKVDVPKTKQTKKSPLNEKVLLQKIYGDDYQNSKVNFIKPVRLYGSSNEVFFIETETSTESFINYTGKTQVITDKEENILLTLLGNEYTFKKIFENKNPFLIITEITNKGNGIHHFYGMENDKVKDFLNTDGWGIQTIGRRSVRDHYVPPQLHLTFEDINNDTFLDAVFSGELIDNNTKKKEEIVLKFIFDTELEMFNLKE